MKAEENTAAYGGLLEVAEEVGTLRKQMTEVLCRLFDLDTIAGAHQTSIFEFRTRLNALEAEAKLADAYQEPEACRKHTCGYYKQYLAYGPAELTHERYHAAEEKLREIRDAWNDHLKPDQVAEVLHPYDCPTCRQFGHQIDPWERRTRAWTGA